MGYKVGLRRLRREIIRVMGKADYRALQLVVGQEERRGVGCGDHEFNGTLMQDRVRNRSHTVILGED